MNYDELYQKMKNYADENGYKLNPNDKERDALLKALLAREREYGELYCPCRRVTGDKEKDERIICPCVYHKEEIERDGKCFCGLFVRG